MVALKKKGHFQRNGNERGETAFTLSIKVLFRIVLFRLLQKKKKITINQQQQQQAGEARHEQ